MSVVARLVSKISAQTGRNVHHIGSKNCTWTVTQLVRNKSSNLSGGSEEIDRPLPFSKSRAANWSANNNFGREKTKEIPWYQPLMISLSVGSILLWFCVLREENDVDARMSRSLYSRVEGLEKNQLELCLKYNEEHGLETASIKKRLQELAEASTK